MTSDSRAPSALPFKAFYFCVFAGPAIVGTYLNLYFQRRGLTDGEIGILAGILSLVGVVSPLLWGAVADRLGSRRRPGIWAMGISGVLFPCFWWLHGHAILIPLIALFGFFQSPLIPLADAAATAYVGRWAADYGRIRVWGSIGYAAVLASMGLLLPARSRAGAAALLPVFVLYLFWRFVGAGCAAKIPEQKGEQAVPPVNIGRAMIQAAAVFRDRRLILVCICAFLGWGAMQAYYTFFPIYLDILKVPDNLKGLYIDIGVGAEILFLTQSGRLEKAIGAAGMLTLGLAAQAGRLLLFAYPVPLWAVALGQTLHAFTFAAFYVACIAFLTKIVPDHLRGGGQAFFSGVVMGLGGAIGSALAGYVAHRHGMPLMFRAGACTAGAACLLSLVLVKMERTVSA
ncbi:MAG TPA: MFS transporter [Armatimonadota bacterium]|nr:MFS transporter [Armatimonadota bacterium]